jgi:heterodisulfide reductase subunit C
VKIEHTLEITATCPVDHLPDVYRCVVRCNRVIPVEKILDAAKTLSSRELYQEDLTLALHRELAADVETVGWHSGVMTRVRVGRDES